MRLQPAKPAKHSPNASESQNLGANSHMLSTDCGEGKFWLVRQDPRFWVVGRLLLS